jgi:O-methyltransferase involved in polyketide biosynthesis
VESTTGYRLHEGADQMITLGAVPETLLWTLFNRATEASRPDAVLRDPEAVRLLEGIDFPFEERFGHPHWSQAQALRALTFDREVVRFLDAHPDSTVISLGEGLETQFWRVDNGRVHWVSVDLPEVIELRERLLPSSPRLTCVSASVLEHSWMKVAYPSPVLVTAQGLLMYLELDDVHALVGAIERAFPGGTFLFDAVPKWLSASTREARPGPGGYVAPPMLWGMGVNEIMGDPGLCPPDAAVTELRMPRGRGVLFGLILPALDRVSFLGETRLPLFPWAILRLEFFG